MENIGEKIYNLRKEKGVSQEELAFDLNVSRQTISQWEAGTSIPKTDKLKVLCEYFNVKPDYFLFECSPAQPLISSAEEAVTTAEGVEIKSKKSHKKTVLIVCAVIVSVLIGAIMFFIAWLEAPTEGVAASVSSSSWNFDVVTILQIIGGIILFVAVCVVVFLLIKYFKNRKK